MSCLTPPKNPTDTDMNFSTDTIDNQDPYFKHSSNLHYYLMVGFVCMLVFTGIFLFLQNWQNKNKTRDSVIIRIFPQNQSHIEQLRQMKFVSGDQDVSDYLEISGKVSNVIELNRLGIPTAVLFETEQQDTVDAFYPTYDNILKQLQELASIHPEIMTIEKIGYSQFNHKPIKAVKISGNVKIDEDEPSVLFMGGHHAREPMGTQVCLAMIRHLVNNKNKDHVKHWLNHLSIWIVPCVNPDGYDYVLTQNNKFPWWRKNLRDNNNNGVFEPEIDGVDLNRNYDFNWANGGRKENKSWYFRGKTPSSESEIKAIMNLAERERFVLAIDYHSFGEVVMFPWALEMKPPDEVFIRDLASGLSQNLSKFKLKKKYDIVYLNGQSGQSANWLYANWRTFALIVEIGKEFFPSKEAHHELITAQLKGMDYLLDRVLSSSLVGHVYDIENRKPLPAMIQLEQDFSPAVEPTRCDEKYGRFHRLVLPGKYSVLAMLDGYKSTKIEHLMINKGQYLSIEIPMEKMSTMEISN